MNADQFLASLQPLLAAGPRGRELAIEEIEAFIAAARWYGDNPEIDPAEIARLQVARDRIAAGWMP